MVVRTTVWSAFFQRSAIAIVLVGSCALVLVGFLLGSSRSPGDQPEDRLPPLLAASAASSDSMAVATGPISDEAEGIFFLDFITGDLQCLVYYPRSGGFGARYVANVGPQLGSAGKSAKYLMVTGEARAKSTRGGSRPGSSLVYVTETNSGMFAAYAVPWDRTAESSGRAQGGQLVYVGGGPIRSFQINPNANQAGAGNAGNNP